MMAAIVHCTQRQLCIEGMEAGTKKGGPYGIKLKAVHEHYLK